MPEGEVVQDFTQEIFNRFSNSENLDQDILEKFTEDERRDAIKYYIDLNRVFLEDLRKKNLNNT